jgi:hypothetical protein
MLPWLRMRAGTLQAEPRATVALALGERAPVWQIFVHELRSSRDARVHVALRGGSGQLLWEDRFTLVADEPRRYHARLDASVDAASAHVTIESIDTEDAVVRVEDMRVLGQPDALQEHIENALDFVPDRER